MPYLLNVVYLALLISALPWLAWQAVRKGKYREGFAAKFLGRAPRREARRPCVWLHAVSVGEVHLLATLLRRIARDRPEWECAISTTTRTGMALAKKKYPDRIVFYCPLDFSWAVRSAVRRIRPNLLVLVELELWPNLIRAAKEAGTRVAVVNGRLSEHSFRGYHRIRPLIAPSLAQIDLVAAQDATYAERFCQLGARAESVQVTGSMKYDGAETDPGNPHSQRLGKLAGFSPADVVFLAGSTQEPEEEVALAVYNELRGTWPNLRLMLVPRHPERFAAVARMLDQSGLPWRRRTELLDVRSTGFSRNPGEQPPKGGTTNGASPAAHSVIGTGSAGSEPRILLVDSVGELGAWWGTAKIAFVGGSLGNRGGQNMIEPAAYGAAVSFGPNTRNFRDIVAAMLRAEAAVVVHDRAELSAFLRRCLEEPGYAAALGGRARALVAGQLGATNRTLRLLENLLETQSASSANPSVPIPILSAVRNAPLESRL